MRDTVELPVFTPDWQLPPGVRALQTMRGDSAAPFGGFNLGDHVGDDVQSVTNNRNALTINTGFFPIWLRQVHGISVFPINSIPDMAPEADAAMTQMRHLACAILTADCLPVLVADCQARVVGAAHAGWRGLAGGVIEQLVSSLTRIPGVTPDDLTVWIGPAIGPEAFEVGREVVDAFVGRNTANESCFKTHPESAGKFLADLPALALNALRSQGVDKVTLSGLCSFSLEGRFYSYRRNNVTGRMASLIWLE